MRSKCIKAVQYSNQVRVEMDKCAIILSAGDVIFTDDASRDFTYNPINDVVTMIANGQHTDIVGGLKYVQDVMMDINDVEVIVDVTTKKVIKKGWVYAG